MELDLEHLYKNISAIMKAGFSDDSISAVYNLID